MSRNIAELAVPLQLLTRKFIAECATRGIDLLVTCTYRSDEEQDALYAQGRTKPGRIVTNAKAGTSNHNKVSAHGKPASTAIDVVPLRLGKPVWDVNDPVWNTVVQIGEGLGLEWAGRWARFKEYAHFQLKPEAPK